MKLQMINIQNSIAESNLNDDAFEMWCYCDFENKRDAAPSAFYSRHHIKKNDVFLYIEFVDEFGEVSYLKCSEIMHNAMMKFKLYPTLISNAFKL